jgi:alkylated DNA nucleotide flippase Atl1
MSKVPDRYRRTTKYVHVLAELVRAAQYRGATTYQDIALIMGLPHKGLHMSREIGWILGEIAEDEVKAGRPMLSAVAVSVKGKPGPGFFDLARQLGKLAHAKDEQAFWRSERDAAYAAWKRPLPK